MSSGNTQSSIDQILKDYYADGALVNETYIDNPFWAKVTKTEATPQVGGRSFIFPVVYATSQGRNTLFSKAQTNGNATSETAAEFKVTRTTNLQVASVATEAVLSTRTDRGAFTNIVTLITDDVLRNLGLDQAGAAYRDGSGSRGNVAASAVQTTFATPTLTFAIPDQALMFENNMELVVAASPTATPRALGSAGHGLYVGKVDSTTGNISVVTTLGGTTPCNLNDATNGIPTIANGDYIFVINDQGQKMPGVEAWIPYGGPTSTLFNGVDRTVQPVRLAGNWLDATNMSVEEAFIKAATIVAKQGNKLTHFYVPFNKYEQLLVSQAAKQIVYDEVNPDIGFDGVELLTSSGTVMVIPDRNCPPDRMYGLNIDTWEYTYVGKDVVSVWDLDGNTWLRQASDNGMEIRFFSYGALVCRKPAANITLKCNP